ncbi:MAG TPA: hypothetical protein VFN10_06470 [Thermoanaerobaculia bacterium]|nr:hypothetical protein [Thermoanaerobaculia bacterium]
MKRAMFVIALVATTAFAQVPVEKVANDAIVFDRVAEASKRDLPSDLLKRIVNEDIELLRGRRSDGSYQYASYERLEAGRITESFSVQPHGDKMQTVEAKGAWIYRVILDSPARRMLVTKNRPVFIDRVDIEYIPQGSSTTKVHSVPVNATLTPRDVKPIDLPEIARQATVRIYAKADEKTGYGNVDVALVQARIVDASDSPYADAVASAKAILRALDANDVPSIRAMASRMRDSLRVSNVATTATTAAVPATRTIEVTAPAANVADYNELQAIEDLLTGTDAEKREGLDRLHQLVRRMRPR